MLLVGEEIGFSLVSSGLSVYFHQSHFLGSYNPFEWIHFKCHPQDSKHQISSEPVSTDACKAFQGEI